MGLVILNISHLWSSGVSREKLERSVSEAFLKRVFFQEIKNGHKHRTSVTENDTNVARRISG